MESLTEELLKPAIKKLHEAELLLKDIIGSRSFEDYTYPYKKEVANAYADVVKAIRRLNLCGD